MTKEDLEVNIKEITDAPLQDSKKNIIITKVIEEERQLKSSMEVVLFKEYKQFRDLFNRIYKALLDYSEWDYTIPLKEGKEPVP